jgi:hypothetical protein
VIVVDNASTDGSVEYLQTHFPFVRIVRNDRNLGVGPGQCIGVKHAQGEYILFLDNDVELDKYCIQRLVETANCNVSVGVVGCKTLHMRQRSLILDVGEVCDTYGLAYYQHEIDRGQYRLLRKVFCFHGAAFLIRAHVLRAIGGPDPAYIAYMWELDLCWRSQLAGYEVVVDPLAVVYHNLGGTTKAMPYDSKRYISERSLMRTLAKNYSTRSLLKIAPRYMALFLAESALLLLAGRIRIAKAHFLAFAWNVMTLKDTWRAHEEVQRIRRLHDKVVVGRMIQRSVKVTHFRQYLELIAEETSQGMSNLSKAESIREIDGA